MRYRPGTDLLAEAYVQIQKSALPSSAFVAIEPEQFDGHCSAAQQGCDCDECIECQSNQTEHHHGHDNSEIHMAKAELRKASEYSQKLADMLENIDELEGWTAAKITKAADYLSSVYHWLDYETHQVEPKHPFTQGAEDCGCGY